LNRLIIGADPLAALASETSQIEFFQESQASRPLKAITQGIGLAVGRYLVGGHLDGPYRIEENFF
jgi:hypothetical protein